MSRRGAESVSRIFLAGMDAESVRRIRSAHSDGRATQGKHHAPLYVRPMAPAKCLYSQAENFDFRPLYPLCRTIRGKDEMLPLVRRIRTPGAESLFWKKFLPKRRFAGPRPAVQVSTTTLRVR